MFKKRNMNKKNLVEFPKKFSLAHRLISCKLNLNVAKILPPDGIKINVNGEKLVIPRFNT